MLKHFVEICYHNKFSLCQEIAERDPELVTLPDDAFGYRFYDQEIDGMRQLSKRKNYSGYTLVGKVYTLDEIKKEFPGHSFIGYMEWAGQERAVLCRGQFRELTQKDTVIEA